MIVKESINLLQGKSTEDLKDFLMEPDKLDRGSRYYIVAGDLQFIDYRYLGYDLNNEVHIFFDSVYKSVRDIRALYLSNEEVRTTVYKV